MSIRNWNNFINLPLFVIILSSTALLPIFFQRVFAQDDHYNSGYSHGCDDAKLPYSDRYINQPGKGPSSHTLPFMNGYNMSIQVAGSNSTGAMSNSTEAMSGATSGVGGVNPEPAMSAMSNLGLFPRTSQNSTNGTSNENISANK